MGCVMGTSGAARVADLVDPIDEMRSAVDAAAARKSEARERARAAYAGDDPLRREHLEEFVRLDTVEAFLKSQLLQCERDRAEIKTQRLIELAARRPPPRAAPVSPLAASVVRAETAVEVDAQKT